MEKKAYHILRFGIGITFAWIGILIILDPLAWSSFISPWVEKFLISSKETTMIITGYFDLLLGLLMIANRFMKITSALASLHLIIVLIVSGFNNATVRDIGLLGGTLALYFNK